MSEHDNDAPDPDAAPDVAHEQIPDPVAGPIPQQLPAERLAPAQARWRDRAFRMRSVAAVAVAGVIIGAAGGAVTTALVAGDRHDRDHHEIGRMLQPGMMPAIPPDGRMRFPGDGSGDQLPFPPGTDDDSDDGTDDGTDDGSEEPSGLTRG